jgi:hypothetical protein
MPVQREDARDVVAPESDITVRIVAGVDVEALAERVYQRFLEDLRRDRERGGWSGATPGGPWSPRRVDVHG